MSSDVSALAKIFDKIDAEELRREVVRMLKEGLDDEQYEVLFNLAIRVASSVEKKS
jgi:hypothetical protein